MGRKSALTPEQWAEVERAWGKLLPFDKDVLRMHYILNMDPRVICRKLRLPHKPASTFNMALAHAKREIAGILERAAENRRIQQDRERERKLVISR